MTTLSYISRGCRIRLQSIVGSLLLVGCFGQELGDHDGEEYPDNTTVTVYKYRITNADGSVAYNELCTPRVNGGFPGPWVDAPVPLDEEYVVNVTWAWGPNEFDQGCDSECYCTRTDLKPGSHLNPYPDCWRSANPESHELLGVKVFDAEGVERTATIEETGIIGLWGDVEQYHLISHVAGRGEEGLVTLEWGMDTCPPAEGVTNGEWFDLVTVIPVN